MDKENKREVLFASKGVSIAEILHQMGDCIALCDKNFNFQAANQNISDWYGLSCEELIGKNVFDVYPEFESSVFFDGAFSTINDGKTSNRLGFSENTKKWLLVRTFKIPAGSVWAAQQINLDNLNRGHTPTYDNITAFGNRILFDETVRKLYQNKIEFGIVTIGIKEFFSIQDEIGPRIGEKCLIEVASRIKSCGAITNQIYRISDNQFAVIIPKTRSNCVFEIHLIANSLKHPFYYTGKPSIIDVAIGFMYVDLFNHNVNYIFEEAEFALAQASRPLGATKMYHEHILTL